MTESQSKPAFDPAALAQAYAEIAQRSSQIVNRYLAMHGGSATPVFNDELGIAKAFYDMAGKLFADPAKLTEMHVKMWQDYTSLWHNSMLRFWGLEAKPVVEPAKGDRRFKHDDWQQNFLFDYIKQSYLIAARNLQAVSGILLELSKKRRPQQKVLAGPEILRQLRDVMALLLDPQSPVNQ